MMPVVSVIIPAFNQARFLSQAIDSVLSQRFPDYEVIVVDDGSTDATLDIVKRYVGHVRSIVQANAGLSAARNRGLREASGEFIGFLDADDEWEPGMLSATVPYLRAHKDVDLVAGASATMDGDGRRLGVATRPTRLRRRVREDALRAFALGNLFPVNAVLVRRRCVDCCGLFDETLGALEDWDLWLRMAAHGHVFDFVDVPVARYRRHGGCMTRDIPRMREAFDTVLGRMLGNEHIASRLSDVGEHVVISARLQLARYCCEVGRAREMRALLAEAAERHAHAPLNEALSGHYFGLAEEFPEMEPFLRSMGPAMHERLVYYYWQRAKKCLGGRDYRAGLEALLRFSALRPAWPIAKMFRRFVGRRHRDRVSCGMREE